MSTTALTAIRVIRQGAGDREKRSDRSRRRHLSINAMNVFFLLPVFAMLTFAQEPVLNRVVQLESISTEATQREAYLHIATSEPLQSPGSVVIGDDSIVWDLPAVVFTGEKHLVVN